jgi:hypothetical protein
MSLPHVLKRIRLELARSKELTTILAQRTTTRPGTASACTPLPPASMFQSVDMRVGPIPSRSCPSSQPRNRAGIYGVSLG